MQLVIYDLLTHVISPTYLQGTMIWHLITQAILVFFYKFVIILKLHVINFHGVTCKAKIDANATST